MKKIVLTGGGTAGHIMPNLALIPELKKHFQSIIYIGSANSMEKDLCNTHQITFLDIPTIKFKRSLSLQNLKIPFVLLKGYFKAKKLLKKIKPNVIFSKGGYVSLPVVFAAKKLNIPVISHESDLNLGLANKLTKNISKKICTSFEITAKKIKNGIFTGSPLREQIFQGNKDIVVNRHKLNNKPVVLIMGGSLGSKIINQIIFDNVKQLTENYNVFHIVGKNNLNKSLKATGYYQFDFCEDIENYLAATDYIISRAGSNAINEFLALKKPMLLIPLSKNASRGDQILNAEYFAQNNYALLLKEENLNTSNLLNKLEQLKEKKYFLIVNMRNNIINYRLTNKKIVDIIIKNAKY